MYIHRLTRLLAALLLLVAGFTISSPARAQGETVVVEAADGNVFEPATITITVGDTVTWRNTDDVPHTSTSEDEVWDSGTLAAGEEFSFTFEEAGTYPYFCEFHPGMEGTVVVQEATQQEEETTQEEEPVATAVPEEATEQEETAATEVPEDTTEGDQQGDAQDDQQGGDTQQDEDVQMPDTGAGGMAGGGLPIGNAAAAASLLLAGGYALLKRR